MREDYRSYAELFRAKATAEDVDDYNRAVSGADVGRILKHGAASGYVDPVTGKKRSSSQDAVQRTLDWLLQNDAVYAQSWHQTSQLLSDVANEADLLLTRLLNERDALSDQIDNAVDRAATLPDGRKVFRDKDGNAVDADGNRIEDDLAAGIIWRGDEPTFEEYIALTDRLTRLENAIRDVHGIETELGGMRNELEDQEAPPSQDELDSFQGRADDFRDRLNRIQDDLDRHADRTNAASFDGSNQGLGRRADLQLPELT
jgi:hypothetical protein